jgi:hypothetical protein
VPALKWTGIARCMLGHDSDHKSSEESAEALMPIQRSPGVYRGEPDTGED